MNNTNIIASSPNINGNIGSCEIKNNTYSVSSFYNRSVSVNSCTGQIISDTTYYDYFVVVIGGFIIGFTILLKVIFD